MNPIKADMVKELADYRWSSYGYNALGQADNLISEHPLYKALGDNAQQRYESYQKMFDKLDIAEQENLITTATLRGEVYGGDRFHQKISRLILRATKLAAHGGDRKSEAYKDQAG